MTKIKMVNMDFEELNVNYAVETIESIVHGKYKEFYSKDDITGNNVRPNDSVMILRFKDGTLASFGSNWIMILE